MSARRAVQLAVDLLAFTAGAVLTGVAYRAAWRAADAWRTARSIAASAGK